jgi:hypothetical protein
MPPTFRTPDTFEHSILQTIRTIPTVRHRLRRDFVRPLPLRLAIARRKRRRRLLAQKYSFFCGMVVGVFRNPVGNAQVFPIDVGG